MMSTPNLEGGLINSDLISSWTLFFIQPDDVPGSTITKTLPFQVKHLIYLTTLFGAAVGPISGSVDIVEGGELYVSTTVGWPMGKITLQGDIVTVTNLRNAAGAIFYFIAVPA